MGKWDWQTTYMLANNLSNRNNRNSGMV